MVAELKPTTLTRREVADLVANYVRRGMPALEAAAQVIEDVRGLGQQEALIDALGPEALVHVWQGAGGASRPERSPKSIRSAPEPVIRPGSPPQRRIELEALRSDASLLEGMYQIGGRWVRLGDMDKAACRAAAQEFKGKALETAHNARYFHALASALNGGETVRQRFDDAGLMRLWEVAGQGA